MPLSSPDLQRLASLRAARDRLLAGEQIAKVSKGDRSVDYAPSSLPELRREIEGLEAQEGGQRRGAIRFAFR